MKESLIEKTICNYAKIKGWKDYKFTSPNNRAVPDRIFFKKGRCILIEFKAPGKDATRLQKKTLEEFSDNGFSTAIIDSIEEGKKFINFIDKKYFGVFI